jgi:hypothetical protein
MSRSRASCMEGEWHFATPVLWPVRSPCFMAVQLYITKTVAILLRSTWIKRSCSASRNDAIKNSFLMHQKFDLRFSHIRYLVSSISTYIQGEHSNFERRVPIKKLFLWLHDFKKLNFKMIARPLPVVPPKCTGVPITQPEKINLMYKSFVLIFKKKI